MQIKIKTLYRTNVNNNFCNNFTQVRSYLLKINQFKTTNQTPIIKELLNHCN